jgi:hypothetical protein
LCGAFARDGKNGPRKHAAAQRKDFWQLLDRAHNEGEKKGFTRLEDLPA